MPESVNELDAVQIVERTLPYLAHHDVRFGAPETDDPVYPAVELCDPASGAARKMIEAHCEMRGLPFCKEGASLIFQRYCHRLCGLASASALITGSVPLLTSGNVSMSLVNGTPKTMWLAENKTIDNPNFDALTAMLLDGHLLEMASNWKHIVGPGIRNLHGNIAASLALGVRKVADQVGLEKAKFFGEELLASRKELRGLGEYEIISAYGKTGLFFHRRSCCHWYAARNGKYCSWCSKRTKQERVAVFKNQMKPKG